MHPNLGHDPGPEAGGGPPPQQEQHAADIHLEHDDDTVQDEALLPSAEHEDDAVRAEALFQSLAAEPYEMVYASPVSIGHQAGSGTDLSSTLREKEDASKQDHQWRIHNLDTGEHRRLGAGALTKSFLRGEITHPEQLPERKPWAGWWAEKRARDEQLWTAAESGSFDMLREALEDPADASAPKVSVNSRSLYGRTALHIAASVGKVEGIELLLDAGADLTARTDAGLTAVHIASQRGHLRVVTLLLDWGAEVCPQTNDRNLPTHFAAINGHMDVVKLLLERGACDQVSIRNSMGQRPAEVSMDIRTADEFKHYETEMSCRLSIISESSPSLDRYAGRTPFRKGAVLLHNARADAVFRLLQRTQNLPDMRGTAYAEMLASQETPEEQARKADQKRANAAPSGRARHPSFAKVRQDRPGIEKVGPDSFLLVERLGKGSFGEVFQVRHRQTSQDYAMKILRKSKIMSGNLLRYAVTERNVLSYIHHPYMVSLHFAFQTRSFLVMVLEFCPGGNLQHLIEREKRLPESLAQLYTAEILLAFIHLHDRSIVFRDLKPDNIVIDHIGHAMLTDFGLSKEGVSALHGTKSFCGSVAFLAPEILQRRGHRHTVDIYGLGVLLFDMLTGLPPFYHPDREKLYHNIKHARLTVPRTVSKPAASLIYALMEREPSQRLGAASTNDVKRHDYFSKVDFEALMRREVPVPIGFVHSPSRSHHNSRPENPFSDKGTGVAKDVDGWSFAGSIP